MPAIFAHVPKTKLTFHLFPDEITSSIEKKLSQLGWPEFDLTFSNDAKLQLEDLGDGRFKYKKGEFGDSLPLSQPTKNASFFVTYDNLECTVTYEFEGEFLVYEYAEVDRADEYTQVKTGYISAVKLVDAKGKNIKKPKNEYGMALPLECTVLKGQYGDVYLAVEVKVISRDEAPF